MPQPSDDPLYFVIDVESVGLMGEGWAVGYVVVNRGGAELDSGIYISNPDDATGTAEDRKWVNENVVPPTLTHVGRKYSLGAAGEWATVHQVRDLFWETWVPWMRKGAIMAAECPYPVEAHFLDACIAQDRTRKTPYPLIDVASVRLAVGFDPLATTERLPNEMPAHNPLADARQSARLLIEALDRYATLTERRDDRLDE